MASSSSSNPSHLHHISLKLSPENYLIWQTQILPLLRSQNLIGFIDGTSLCPPETITPAESTAPIPNPVYADWMCKDQLVLSWIISSLSPEVLPYAVGLPTAAFGTLSHTSILQLHMQLQDLEKGDKTISTYLRQVKFLSDQLSAANRPLATEELNAIIFRNLGNDYNDVVAALATHTEHVPFHVLHRLLLSHEIRVNSTRSVCQANLAQVQRQLTTPPPTSLCQHFGFNFYVTS